MTNGLVDGTANCPNGKIIENLGMQDSISNKIKNGMVNYIKNFKLSSSRSMSRFKMKYFSNTNIVDIVSTLKSNCSEISVSGTANREILVADKQTDKNTSTIIYDEIPEKAGNFNEFDLIKTILDIKEVHYLLENFMRSWELFTKYVRDRTLQSQIVYHYVNYIQIDQKSILRDILYFKPSPRVGLRPGSALINWNKNILLTENLS